MEFQNWTLGFRIWNLALPETRMQNEDEATCIKGRAPKRLKDDTLTTATEHEDEKHFNYDDGARRREIFFFRMKKRQK